MDDREIDTNTMFSERRLKAFLERARRASVDEDRHSRVESRECKCCFYAMGPSGGGRAFTAYKCVSCGESDSWPSTSVPKVCKKCSMERDVCRRCAGRMHTEPGT